MKVLVIAILGAMFSAAANADHVVKTGRSLHYVDLTRELHESIPKHPIYNGLELNSKEVLFGEEKLKVKVDDFSMPTHYGTHMDAPCHISGNWCLADIPLERLVDVPAVVIDVSRKVFVNESVIDSDYLISKEDITEWEGKHGRIPENGVVLFHTGWERYWDEPLEYLGGNSTDNTHSPGISKEAAKFLVEERSTIYGVGIDTVNIDYGLSQTLGAHVILTSVNMYALENLYNLGRLPPTGSDVTLGILKLGREASGAPARVIARYFA